MTIKNILKKKNKKGSTIFVRLMLGLVCFIFGLAIASPMLQVTSASMTQMNCTNATNYQTQTVCTTIDWMLPFIVGLCFALAGFLLGGRL